MMDPLGFALENFDGLGTLARHPRDPGRDRSILRHPRRRHRVQRAGGLARSPVEKQDMFVENFTERLLTYALGRGVEEYDHPVIRKITREAAAGQSAVVIHHSRHRQQHAISNEEG